MKKINDRGGANFVENILTNIIALCYTHFSKHLTEYKEK